MTAPFSFDPIGVVRSPWTERSAAPRQSVVARDVEGRIELAPGHGYEHALEGLEEWEYAWVVFVFHRNVEEGRGWRAKVLPPRSREKRGVFATRSPHRPNPIGLSAVRILGVEGTVIHVCNVDLLDQTPVLDLKPYVAYADAYPEARSGWLEAADPIAPWEVCFADAALAEMAWLRARGVDLRPSIEAALGLGPEPNPYRRIRRQGASLRLAIKEWRANFVVDGRRIVVCKLASGYRVQERLSDPALEVHRAFAERWG